PAIEEGVTEVILPPIMAALGRAAIARRGARQVRRHAPAVLLAAADHVHRLGVSLVGSAGEPTECRALVPLHPAAIEQHPAQAQLGGGYAALGGAADPDRRFCRIAGEQR